MNSLGFIEFLKHALKEVTGKLVIFADHHRMHQTPLVLEFVKLNEERLALGQISKWLTVFVRPISSNTSRNKGVLHALVTCASGHKWTTFVQDALEFTPCYAPECNSIEWV